MNLRFALLCVPALVIAFDDALDDEEGLLQIRGVSQMDMAQLMVDEKLVNDAEETSKMMQTGAEENSEMVLDDVEETSEMMQAGAEENSEMTLDDVEEISELMGTVAETSSELDLDGADEAAPCVNGFRGPYNHKILAGWTSKKQHGKWCFKTADAAKAACANVQDCGGITKQNWAPWVKASRIGTASGTAPGQYCPYYALRRSRSPSTDHGANGTSWTKCPGPPFHLAPPGAATCDYGTTPSAQQCLAAVQQLTQFFGKRQGRRTLQQGKGGRCLDGSWGMVPGGCSAQTGTGPNAYRRGRSVVNGDWAAHYKSGTPTKAGCVHKIYQLVCTGAW